MDKKLLSVAHCDNGKRRRAMSFVHTVRLVFIVSSTNPTKPTFDEIVNTIDELRYQAPDYLTCVEVIDTAKEGPAGTWTLIQKKAR